MKLKVIRAHYYNNKYREVGDIYRANRQHCESSIRRGNCEPVPIKRRPRRDKRHPVTNKGKLEIK